jgi:FkbM family methyltransferase
MIGVTSNLRISKLLRRHISQAYYYLYPDAWLRRRLSDDRWHEIEARYAVLSILVDPTRAAVDVGAHAGKYSYELSKLVRTVHAVEPDQELARKLKRALPANVIIHSLAASNREGTAQFNIPIFDGRAEVATASIEPMTNTAERQPFVSKIVPTITLDRLISEPVGFLKIDVEGHELAVLEGALGLLKRDLPTVLVEAEERHRPGSVYEVRSLMEGLSYAGFFIYKNCVRVIDEFTVEMQNPSELKMRVKRIQMNYVNNFIYTPAARAVDFKRRLQRSLESA